MRITTIKAAVLCLFCTTLILFATASYARGTDYDALLKERTAVCYIDGTEFEELVIGAQGSIRFVFLDSKLSGAMSKARSDLNEGKVSRYPFPQWIEDGGAYFAREGKRGYVVFIAELETFKPWDVDPAQVFVGGYHLTKNDIQTSSMNNPFGDVPSGTVGYFVFTVPKSEVKPGAEIALGYGEYGVKWKVPK